MGNMMNSRLYQVIAEWIYSYKQWHAIKYYKTHHTHTIKINDAILILTSMSDQL